MRTLLVANKAHPYLVKEEIKAFFSAAQAERNILRETAVVSCSVKKKPSFVSKRLTCDHRTSLLSKGDVRHPNCSVMHVQKAELVFSSLNVAFFPFFQTES